MRLNSPTPSRPWSGPSRPATPRATRSEHYYAAGVSERRRVTVLYDKDCGFCRWSAHAIRRWDGRDSLAFASIQSGRGTRLLHAIRPELRLDSMHVVTADGRIWSGGEAV